MLELIYRYNYFMLKILVSILTTGLCWEMYSVL